MAFSPIKIPPGIERNNTPYETVDRWWDMSQVRWQSGSMMPIGGWNRLTASPLDSPARAFHVWRNNVASRMVLVGTDTKLYVDDSGAYVDITPSAFAGPDDVLPTGGFGTGDFGDDTFGTPRAAPSPIFSPYGYWSLDNWGEDVILTANTDGRLFYYTQSTPTTTPYRIGPAYASANAATGTITISGTTMTVAGSPTPTGTFAVGQKITGTGLGVDAEYGTLTITALGSGTGGAGTYTVSKSQTLTSRAITAHAPTTTGAPISVNSVVVTPERHVMAIGYAGDPRGIAWSSREDNTDWDFASVTNTAGNLPLTSKTPLLYGTGVAEGTLVFSYTDVFLIRYLGGTYIYGGTEPISDTSLFNPRTVATFGGKAAWPTRSGFQLYAGGFVQPLPCPVASDIFGETGDPAFRMDPTWGTFRFHGAHNFRFSEIWWFYPSVGNDECNRYVVWNYADNWWAWGELARSAMAPADAYQYPYMGGTTGHVFEHEVGFLDNGASRVGQCFVESGALGLPGDNLTVINQMMIATGQGYQNLSVTLYGTYAPEGTEYTEGPFLPRDDGYTDMRAEYRDMRVRLSNAQDGNFSVGTIKADIMPGGES